MFVTDTHPLIWYINQDLSKISEKVRQAFEKTTAAETFIYVSAVVLWEIAILEKLNRVRLKDRFDRWANGVLRIEGLQLAPLEVQTIHRAVGYGSHKDPFDSLIVATAAELEMPLITKMSSLPNRIWSNILVIVRGP